MAISVSRLTEYMKHGLNIYITGKAGTGKTEQLKAAANKNNYKLGYLSAPTLDAYVDIVGIPVAEKDKVLKKRVLEFVRKQDFDDIEVLFIDELPRGELKTLNAIFEIVQFGTINGDVAVPNLKCVVAAGNPLSEEYVGQQQLDEALVDRFDMYLETSADADRSYFINTFGVEMGKALVDWHNAHDHQTKGYLSPRRLEKIGHTWLKMPRLSTIKDMLPPGGEFNAKGLDEALRRASARAGKLNESVDEAAPIADRISLLDDTQVRKAKDEIIAALPDLSREEMAVVTERVATALQRGIRVEVIINEWAPVLEYFSNSDKQAMLSRWSATQNTEFLTKSNEAKLGIGKNLKNFS